MMPQVLMARSEYRWPHSSLLRHLRKMEEGLKLPTNRELITTYKLSISTVLTLLTMDTIGWTAVRMPKTEGICLSKIRRYGNPSIL
jgi:hypothetical protein